MSNPPETNLTQKFAALQNLITEQHNALLEKIDALMGSGPENTIRSVNQSLWNIAGPAPGTNLTQIAAAITALMGTTTPRTLRDLYEVLTYDFNSTRWTTAGLLHVLKEALNTDSNITVGFLLERINTALGGVPDDSLTLSSVRGLLNTINQSVESSNLVQSSLLACCEENGIGALDKPITGLCANPFSSSSSAVLSASISYTAPVTVAVWDFSNTTEFEAGYFLGFDDTMLIKTVSEPIDWSGYRFYVASAAQMFGAVALDPQRWPTNKWVTLPYAQSLMFTVDSDRNDLKVYICPASSSGELGICANSEDPLTITSWVESPKTRPGTHTFDMASMTGGETWQMDVSFHMETPANPTSLGYIVTRAALPAFCIAWQSSEPDLVQIGIRAFYYADDFSEVGLTVTPVSINTSGNAGALICAVNTSGYQVDELIFVPYLSYGTIHSGDHNVAVQISYVAP